MATLEVHDAQGRVRFVDLAMDHPVLFGSSASCDIVVEGAGIMPVQGRIRWGKNRFKVDASPDAESLIVNGRHVVTTSLHQGDELTVGPCRIFVLRLDDAADGRAAAPQRPRPDEEPTRVLEDGVAPAPRPAAVQVQARPSMPPRREALFENDALLDALHIGTPAPVRSDDKEHRRRVDVKPKAALWSRLRDRLVRARSADDAPGREVIARSPLVLSLVVMLALLIGLGFWLRTIINQTLASRTYNRAVSLMEDGDNPTAIREFDSFVTANPTDPRAPKARTLRALADVRQYVTVTGATWSAALEAAASMVDTVGDETEFRDEKSELAELVIRIGEGLADRAKRSVDAKSLAEAESAIPLHARIAGESAQAFLTKSRLPSLLDEARAAVRKAQIRTNALAVMDKAIEKGSAAQVYKARDALVDQYADLKTDAELLSRMVRANDLVRAAVKVDRTHRPAAVAERPEPLGPPTTLVLRSSPDVPAAPPAADAIVYAAADGIAYAIDAATGAPLWQTAVGLSCPFVPQPVPGDPTVLVFDARHGELARRNAQTGRLLWRLELGETVDAPPLVLGEQLFQVLPSGKTVVVALGTGELQATIDMGFPATRTPAGDESGRFLYVAGRKDCLFVLARDPLGCAAVEYLGHSEGSIACAPVRLGRFLIVVENDRPSDGRWRVMVLDDDGAKPRVVQEIPVAGWTWDAPPSSGSTIWAVGDRGGIEAFAAGDYASANPFHSLAKLSPDAQSSGPAYAWTASDREIWIAAERSGRFDLDAERGEVASRALLGKLGVASAPIQGAARRVVPTFQDPETGGLALRGVDPATGRIAWETVVGAAWPTSPTAIADGDALASVGLTGQPIRLPRATLQKGGFITSSLPKPGDARLPEGTLLNLQAKDEAASLIAPRPGADAVWTEDAKQPGRWSRIELPSALAAAPVFWNRALLVPGEDGRVYLIDPHTGTSRAEPLVPAFDRDRRGRWLAPCRTGDDVVFLAEEGGRVRRVGLKPSPAPRLVVEAETLLDQGVIANPACIGAAVMTATADGRVRALASRDLSPIGSWKLDAPILGDPLAVDGRLVVLDASGGVLLFGRDGQRAWSSKLDAPASGSPLVVGDALWILDRKGKAHGLAIADGKEVETVDLGVLPAGGLALVGGDVFVPSGRGSLQPLVLGRPAGAKP
ncbi:MAG: PQQ-binding-like beta-propeller repeat protein [Paludisphaera borealis]|uniref:outer membrane protein assembly factor BamB family protein n=1 Tax=Paludisphaera borealis TaxID=1387353 RepID=UPI00285053E7|nr:PQQ-binding-like beta-propeller repeat protein [Paludisphaera borealis]MDR3620840.1 PQQ-binding-like beta-propeller repeat protein [Paludisphaera borealis]